MIVVIMTTVHISTSTISSTYVIIRCMLYYHEYSKIMSKTVRCMQYQYIVNVSILVIYRYVNNISIILYVI